jgi:hypothetical protein
MKCQKFGDAKGQFYHSTQGGGQILKYRRCMSTKQKMAQNARTTTWSKKKI